MTRNADDRVPTLRKVGIGQYQIGGSSICVEQAYPDGWQLTGRTPEAMRWLSATGLRSAWFDRRKDAVITACSRLAEHAPPPPRPYTPERLIREAPGRYRTRDGVHRIVRDPAEFRSPGWGIETLDAEGHLRTVGWAPTLRGVQEVLARRARNQPSNVRGQAGNATQTSVSGADADGTLPA